MRKFMLLFLALIICAIFVQNGVNAVQYWCNTDKIEGTFDMKSSGCQHWKEHSVQMYKHCMNLNKLMAQAYRAGKCEPILERKFEENGTVCNVLYLKSNNKNLGTSCSGSNSEQLRKKIEKMYK